MNPDPEKMKTAIYLARSGERERAQILFKQIAAGDPDNCQAWLWLSELADDLDEQTAMLEQAVKHTPDGGKDLQSQLIELRGLITLAAPAAPVESAAPVPAPIAPADKSLLEKSIHHMETYNQAERLAILGKRAEALQKLRGLAFADCTDERVWQLLSELQPDLGEKIRALEKVAALNPANEKAAARLQALQKNRDHPLQAGLYLESSGEPEQALDLYRAVAGRAGANEDCAEAARRVTRLEQREKGKNGRSPVLGFLRSLFKRT